MKHKTIYIGITFRMLSITLIMLTISMFYSCTGIYDSLSDFAKEETIYPSSFDTIVGRIGYERVEIDLSTKGRIPASQMNLAKAKKTIIECSYFNEPLIIDSVCSWVNVTGLTEPGDYTFKIFTADEYGNRSIPKEISLTPYTSYDLEKLEILPPKFIEAKTSILLEWERKLSGLSFDCTGYSYEYTDKNGLVQSGSGIEDIPTFVMENIIQGDIVPVKLTLQIIPKISNTSIIDTINWTSIIPVTISGLAPDVIFLKYPLQGYTIDLNNPEIPQTQLFSWAELESVSGYILKISTDPNFPDDKTFIRNVGNKSSFELNISDISEFVASGSSKCYWTVLPSSMNTDVNLQKRNLNIYRQLSPSGLWLFDNPSDPFNGIIGAPLIEGSAGTKITLAAGPSESNKALFVPEYSYLICEHGISPKLDDKYVNEYSILMDLKLTSFKWFSIAHINPEHWNGQWFISPSGEAGVGVFWGSSAKYMELNKWHRVIFSVKLDERIKIYLDGELANTINTDTSWKDHDHALRPQLYILKDDDSWNDRNNAYISELRIWDSALNDLEVENVIN